MNRVDGKVALVSGAARGIGAETAATLAKAGARVVLTDLLAAAGEATAAPIVAAGGEAIVRRHDVTSEDDWAAATAAAVDQFGGLARISQCAPTARVTRGGRIHPDSCRFDLVASRRFRRVTGGIEALRQRPPWAVERACGP